MEEGTIAKWHKKVGDQVKSGDLLVEVATDKATVEYNALDEGYLRKILIPDGGAAIVNQPIAIFTEKANESIEGYKPEGSSQQPLLQKRKNPRRQKESPRKRLLPPKPRRPSRCSNRLLRPNLLWKNMNLNSRQVQPKDVLPLPL